MSFANKNVSGLQKYLRFQNEYNKVEIELRVVQFWTEIKLVITNRTPASRSCDFVITRLISVQIALHSVQLPSLIALRSAINDFRDGWGEREIKTAKSNKKIFINCISNLHSHVSLHPAKIIS